MDLDDNNLVTDMKPYKKEFVFEPFMVKEVKCRGFDIPRPRSGHRIACDDKKIYCFGGYNPSLPRTSMEIENPTWRPDKPLFKELWSFSIANRKWKQHKVVKNMPEELASNAMCMYGKYLMIYGGTGCPFGEKCSNDVITWESSEGDAALEVLSTTGTAPPGQYGQAILCYDSGFYAIGGTNGFAYNCDIYRLDLRTLEWEPIFIGRGDVEEPLGRYRHEVSRVGDKFYIIGGGTGEWAFELMEIPIFDLITRKWETKTPRPDDSMKNNMLTPLPRKCHSTVQVDTPNGAQLFVVGGSDGQSVFEDIWRLNVQDLQWTLMQNCVLPHPLYFHSSSVTSQGCMYVFGGIEPKNDATSRNNVMYKVWLCIPKLSEISWEALLHYHPNLDSLDRGYLLNLGVPSHFVNRI